MQAFTGADIPQQGGVIRAAGEYGVAIRRVDHTHDLVVMALQKGRGAGSTAS